MFIAPSVEGYSESNATFQAGKTLLRIDFGVATMAPNPFRRPTRCPNYRLHISAKDTGHLTTRAIAVVYRRMLGNKFRPFSFMSFPFLSFPFISLPYVSFRSFHFVAFPFRPIPVHSIPFHPAPSLPLPSLPFRCELNRIGMMLRVIGLISLSHMTGLLCVSIIILSFVQ